MSKDQLYMLENRMTWLVPLVVSMIAIPVWVFNTFATEAYVKEANARISQYVEERHADSVQHSDMNRTAMQEMMKEQQLTLQEIRDSLKVLENRLWNQRK